MFFGSLEDLVWGEVEDVELVLDKVRKGEQIVSVDSCDSGEVVHILKVKLKNAVSLFNGDVGDLEFRVPHEALANLNSKPMYFTKGEWFPQNEELARIDGSLGWSHAEEGVQVGQTLLVPLFLSKRGHLYTHLLPMYEERDGLFTATDKNGQHIDTDHRNCFRFPEPFNTPFAVEDVIDAYETHGNSAGQTSYVGNSYYVEETSPACLEPIIRPPSVVVETDMGN